VSKSIRRPVKLGNFAFSVEHVLLEKVMDQVESLAVKPVLKSDADINNPATKALVALAILAVLPAFVPIPVNINIIATASLCVFVGCWRSVKASPPEDSMSRKVGSTPVNECSGPHAACYRVCVSWTRQTSGLTAKESNYSAACYRNL